MFNIVLNSIEINDSANANDAGDEYYKKFSPAGSLYDFAAHNQKCQFFKHQLKTVFFEGKDVPDQKQIVTEHDASLKEITGLLD